MENSTSAFQVALNNAREALSKDYIKPTDQRLLDEIHAYRSSLSYMCTMLEKADEEIASLKKINLAINVKIASLEATDDTDGNGSDSYWTDEDQLDYDTGAGIKFKPAPPRKRKKKNTPPKNTVEPTPVLQKDKVKVIKPPPITLEPLSDIGSFLQLKQKLKEIAPNSITTTLSSGQIKINANDSDEYRDIDKYLESIKCLYYTYQNKQTRPYSVMLKGLPGGIDVSTVLATVQEEYPLLKATRVTQKLKWPTKEKLDMYIVDFETGADVKKIHEITRLYNCRVKIESIRNNDVVPQCKRCQEFGTHTQNYCKRRPRCVKCGKNHETASCVKPKSDAPTCANCGGDHTANYRQCPVAVAAAKAYKEKIKGAKSRAGHDNQPRDTTLISAHKPSTSRTGDGNDYAFQNQAEKENRKEGKKPFTPKAPILSQNRHFGHNKVSYAQVTASATSQPAPEQSAPTMASMLQTLVTQVGQMQQQMLAMSQKIEALEKKTKPGRPDKKSKWIA